MGPAKAGLTIIRGSILKNRAFTLIELMIVIAIIAILAAILIPNFLHARAESVTAACEGNEKQIATAEEEYAVDNGGVYVAFATLTTPYLSVHITDPVKAGNAYTVNTTAGAYGSYQISDAGGHDPTTMGSIPGCNGGACLGTVLYNQNSGISGK